MCDSATTKARHVILDFDMLSEIITFEQKGKYSKEKHQNLCKDKYVLKILAKYYEKSI